jgi:hypothetical protein
MRCSYSTKKLSDGLEQETASTARLRADLEDATVRRSHAGLQRLRQAVPESTQEGGSLMSLEDHERFLLGVVVLGSLSMFLLFFFTVGA